VKRITVDITTDSGAVATVYSPPVYGRVLNITALHDTLATTADLTISEEDTGLNILVITNLAADARYPIRIQSADSAGAAIAGQYESPTVSGRIKVVVAQGGNVKHGKLLIDVDDMGDGASASAFATRTLTRSADPALYAAIIDGSDDPNLVHN
jgi:hypothetical protein